ncbi:MAG TPA: CDP-alcohol phosphatidyltransferase family protein [Candidatus Udaeobacter sp.]|jgi:phosphatidylglycerophosphate synthase
MENALPVLIADGPGALVELCGVNLLERLLRILQRLGFQHALVVSTTPEIVEAELAKRSWARDQLMVHLASSETGPITPRLILEQSSPERLLIIPANIYCDARLLSVLCAKKSPAVLVDSDAPEFARSLVRNPCGPALVTKDFLFNFSPTTPLLKQLNQRIDDRGMDIVDAATQDDYVVSMRRRVRLFCFPAPAAEDRRLAERIILDSAQNGTLDLPAYVHAPIETAIVSRLCRTRVTPNQITIAGLVIGCAGTVAFVVGRVGFGILAALIFGVVDGLDGKLSRVKVETTKRGEWEHQVDTFVENSWWAAIAFHLWRSGQLPNAFYFLALLIASHLLDEFAKRRVKIATGRLMDDVLPFERAFRLVAARRNVFVWILAGGFLLGAFPKSYGIICGWAAFSAAVHLVRSFWICNACTRTVINSRA